MPKRLLAFLVLSSLLTVAALAGTAGSAGAIRIPKLPKVTEYPITIDVVGHVEYSWTVDTRSQCVPGYAKTVEEEFGFELGRPRRTKLAVVGGNVVMTPVKGGQAKLHVSLGGFQTTNYCPPSTPVEIPEPECKSFSGKLGVALSPLAKDEGDDLVPLGSETLITLWRTNPQAQIKSCHELRPKIEAEREADGVGIDPYAGIVVPSGISNTEFFKLKPGGKEVGHTKISGGCGRAKAHASSIPSYVTRCTVEGSIVTIVKRVG